MDRTSKLYKVKTVFVMVLACVVIAQAQTPAVDSAAIPAPPIPVVNMPPKVDAVYQVRPLAGGPAVLKLTEWDGSQSSSAGISNTGLSYDVDMKVGPLSGKIYMFYVVRSGTAGTFPVYLDIRSSISTSLGVYQFPLPPTGLTIKSLAIAVRPVGTTEEVHAIVLAETATQARVYYSRLTATGWTPNIIAYQVLKNSKRFGTNAKMEFFSPTSTEVMITYPEIGPTVNGTFGNIVTWKFNTTTLASFSPPAIPFLRTPVTNNQVWGGEIFNSIIPRAEPMDFMTDPGTGNTVIAAVPAITVSHQYPEAGINVYSGNSLTNMSLVRTILNTAGPWGSGALTLAQSGNQKIFKLVTLEQGTNPGFIQMGLGGKEIKIYTSPQGTVAPTPQLIDGTLTGPPYFTYPAVTTLPRYNETYAGVIYDNNGASVSCSGALILLCHQVRLYSFNGASWSHVKLDSAPTATHKIEKLKITSR